MPGIFLEIAAQYQVKSSVRVMSTSWLGIWRDMSGKATLANSGWSLQLGDGLTDEDGTLPQRLQLEGCLFSRQLHVVGRKCGMYVPALFNAHDILQQGRDTGQPKSVEWHRSMLRNMKCLGAIFEGEYICSMGANATINTYPNMHPNPSS